MWSHSSKIDSPSHLITSLSVKIILWKSFYGDEESHKVVLVVMYQLSSTIPPPFSQHFNASRQDFWVSRNDSQWEEGGDSSSTNDWVSKNSQTPQVWFLSCLCSLICWKVIFESFDFLSCNCFSFVTCTKRPSLSHMLPHGREVGANLWKWKFSKWRQDRRKIGFRLTKSLSWY